MFYPRIITNKMEHFISNSSGIALMEIGKMCRHLKPKKTKVRLYYPFKYVAVKDVLATLHY